MGAHFEALDEDVLMASLESRYTRFGFNLISVKVCPCMPFRPASYPKQTAWCYQSWIFKSSSNLVKVKSFQLIRPIVMIFKDGKITISEHQLP